MALSVSIFGKPLEAVTESDLQAIIAAGIAENRIVEYKSALPGRTNEDKKEFTRDVVSFANSAGGHIIYGMTAAAGVPTGFSGIEAGLLDAEKLRLEQIIRSSVEPVIHGFRIQGVPLPQTGGNVLIAEIPRALFGPHMIRGRGAFLSRTSAGKMEMDFGEIRAAFVGAETATNKLRDFHAERTARLAVGNSIMPLEGQTVAVLHVLPLEGFTPGFRCDLSRISGDATRRLLEPRQAGYGWQPRFSLEGFSVFHTSGMPNQPHYAYVHTFRNGSLEYANSELETGLGPKTLRAGRFECMILAATAKFMGVQDALGMRGPFYVFPSLLNAKGWSLAMPARGRYATDQRTIEKEHLILPEVMLENGTEDLEAAFRPCFDVLWNACGWMRSFSYDDTGAFQLSQEWRRTFEG
jgi:hypothetical protein